MSVTLIAILVLAASPADETRAALADLKNNVPALARSRTRYLSLYSLPVDEWDNARATASFVLNSVSRADTIAAPEVVPGVNGRLLRISLDRYGLPPDVWEAMAAEDPYWHIRTSVIDPRSSDLKEVFTDGGWVPLAAAAELRNLSQSGGAVLRVDFFVARAATTADGGYYYALAGVAEKEVDFLAGLGVDRKTIGRLHADVGANVIDSGVTRKVRRIVRRQGPLGGAWQTYDVVDSTPERDPFRNPFAFRYDASEHIATRASGMHVFSLYDAQGRRQDAVPDVVAKDDSDPHGAGVIEPMISCVRCHVEDGLRPFSNDQERLLAGGVDLFTTKPSDAERLARFYASDLEKHLRRDREDYRLAVGKATGSPDVATAAAGLARMYGDYVDRLVSPSRAAAELGLTETVMRRRLAASDDPVILALCEGISVQRRQWEASFAQAATLAVRTETEESQP